MPWQRSQSLLEGMCFMMAGQGKLINKGAEHSTSLTPFIVHQWQKGILGSSAFLEYMGTCGKVQVRILYLPELNYTCTVLLYNWILPWDSSPFSFRHHLPLLLCVVVVWIYGWVRFLYQKQNRYKRDNHFALPASKAVPGFLIVICPYLLIEWNNKQNNF